MPVKTKYIIISFYLYAALLCVYTGLYYLSANELMSYHQTAIGLTWQALAPKLQFMVLVMIKGIGIGALTCGAGILLILSMALGDQRLQQSLRLHAVILTFASCWYLPFIGLTFWVFVETQAATPYWVLISGWAATFIAFILAGISLAGTSRENRST